MEDTGSAPAWIYVIFLSVAPGFKRASLVAQKVKEFSCNSSDPGWEDSLEKEMATHSSTLAWRIPWTEEPGGL